jgi:hypothetical protein
MTALACGCSMNQTGATRPGAPPAQLMTAAKPDLIASFNQQADGVTSINASVTMTLTAGSAYTGVIKQYHQVSAFILAQKPSDIRVIGQVPVVGTNIFDMQSDGTTFHIFIPSEGKFVVGPANLERPSPKPIENLRPQHLTAALFWQPTSEDAPVLLEEASEGPSQYYVLTVVRVPKQSNGEAPVGGGWEIARKIWFDRADLKVARVETYDPAGRIESDDRYSKWAAAGTDEYPRQISINRPASAYQLQIGIVKLTLNQPISPDHFVLQQPAGTQLVEVGQESSEARP